MTEYVPKDEEFGSFKDKVLVVTGGANGMAACLVALLHQHGAKIVFGDIKEADGRALIQRLESATPDPPGRLQFVKCDVASYEDNLALFQAALDSYGRVDHAVAAAGVGGLDALVDPALDLETVKQPPPLGTINIDLLGPIYFARIASVYLRQGVPASASRNCSLTFVSSSAGILEDTGLFQYQAAKHGVVGLMRSMRRYLPISSPQPIRTNVICPWFTTSNLTAGAHEAWAEFGLPKNEPEEVAHVIAGVLADTNLNGETLFVTLGGRAWAIEQQLTRLRPEWLGEEPARFFAKGIEIFGDKGWTEFPMPPSILKKMREQQPDSGV